MGDVEVKVGQRWCDITDHNDIREIVGVGRVSVAMREPDGEFEATTRDFLLRYFEPIVPIPAVPDDVFPVCVNVYANGTDGWVRPPGDADRYATIDRIAKIRIDGWDADGKLLGEVAS